MPEFPSQPFTAVYLIFSVDVVADSERSIERMSPASHMPAGRSGERQAEFARVAGLFKQTEGNEQYQYGYLGNEHRPRRPRYFPAGYTDSGCGYHRKWTAELTRDEWLLVADAYLIDLDDADYPEDFEETLGAITEHGHLEAIAVDLTEGWQDYSGDDVIEAQMYVSFAYGSDPN